MSSPRAKRLEYAAATEADGRIVAEGKDDVALPEGWTPEHLVLAALPRCTLAALHFHARRRDIAVEGRGEARGVVTRREPDGLYALVEVECALEVTLEPAPDEDAVADLILRAERGCFVGSSLAAKPAYRWTVNGRAFE